MDSRILGRLLLVLLSSGLALGVFELALRAQEPFLHILTRGRYSDAALYAFHPVWDHWLRPHSVVTTDSQDPEMYHEPVIYQINGAGCRHPEEVLVPKPGGVFRVILLGDSFIEGNYYADTIGVRLQRGLNEVGDGTRFEVINCGCSSYSPLLEYLRLKHQLLALQPDAVLLDFDQTDVYDDNVRYRPTTRWMGDEPAGVGRQDWRIGARNWASGHSYLAQVGYPAYSRLFLGLSGLLGRPSLPTEENIFEYYERLPVSSATWESHVSFTIGNLSRSIDLAAQSRVVLGMSVHPHRGHLVPDNQGRLWHQEIEKRIERLCRERNVPFYSAFDAMSAALAAGVPVFFRHDMHYAPPGERIWAKGLSDFFTPIIVDAARTQPHTARD